MVAHDSYPEAMPVDPYLVASRLADDAVIAYHGALQFRGTAYSAWSTFPYLTRRHKKPFSFRGSTCMPVQAPATPLDRPNLGGGIETRAHAGLHVRVASLERTLVDVWDAPLPGGGWKEMWRSLEMIEHFDLDAVLDYARKLASAAACARVGFFLEQHRGP